MILRALHRTSAILIVAFASVHIANHLVSLSSVASHIAFMELARKIYRDPYVESVLLSGVAFQIVSGLWLFIRGWQARQGRIAWLQAASGAYLAFFLLVHVGAVLFGRAVLNLDTNFYFAAVGLHVPPNQFFFAPYYFFAIVALFTHVGCAAYWKFRAHSRVIRMLALALPMAFGGVVALLIVLSLAGMVKPFEVPAKYKATYGQTDVIPLYGAILGPVHSLIVQSTMAQMMHEQVVHG